MDTHCFQLEHGKLPIVFFVWGRSLELASTVFQLFQKAECPRRLKVFALELYQQGRYAASYYDEFQKFQGHYDTSFLEQISWLLLESDDAKSLRPLIDLSKLVNGPTFVERDLPVGALLRADENVNLVKNYDSMVLQKSSQVAIVSPHSTNELLTATSNSFSRISTAKGTPHIEWIPIFGHYEKIAVSFPSSLIFGPMKNILSFIQSMHNEWPQIADDALYFLSGLSLHMFSFHSCHLLESMTSLQKMPSRIVKEITARQPGQTSLFTEQHLLGLDPSCAKYEIVAKQKSMREYETNLNQIRKN